MFSPIPEVAIAPVWSVARLIAPYASRVEGTRIMKTQAHGVNCTQRKQSHGQPFAARCCKAVQPHGRDLAIHAAPVLSISGLKKEHWCARSCKDVRLARIPLFERTVDSKKYRIERQDYFGIDLLAYKASVIGQDYSVEPPSR